ncbi:hypothetical protein [Streptomyces sp. NPDC001340]
MAVALSLLLVGIVVTWWAPADEGKDKPVYLKVSHPGGPSCGTLASADGGRFRLRIPGRHEPVVVPLRDVTNVAVVRSCR